MLFILSVYFIIWFVFSVHFLSSQRALQIFASHLDNTEDALPISLLTEPLSTLYQQAEKDHSGKVKCGQNIDMTTSWILDMHNR